MRALMTPPQQVFPLMKNLIQLLPALLSSAAMLSGCDGPKLGSRGLKHSSIQLGLRIFNQKVIRKVQATHSNLKLPFQQWVQRPTVALQVVQIRLPQTLNFIRGWLQACFSPTVQSQ